MREKWEKGLLEKLVEPGRIMDNKGKSGTKKSVKKVMVGKKKSMIDLIEIDDKNCDTWQWVEKKRSDD